MTPGPGAVVVGVDGSPAADAALVWAAEHAAAEHRSLAVVHAAQALPADYTEQLTVLAAELPDLLRREGQRVVERARELAEQRAPGLEVLTRVALREPREVLLGLSSTASLLVVGSRGRGTLRSLLLGSVSVAVAEHSACPVLVHRPPAPEARGAGVLVAVDLPDVSQPVLEFAYRQAELQSAPLAVVHCYDDHRSVFDPGYITPEQSAALERATLALGAAVAGLSASHPQVEVTTRLARGNPARHLVEATESRELLVIGGHRGARRGTLPLGSVSVSVVEHAHCPVAVVPVRLG